MITDAELVQYYRNLLIIQYRGKERAGDTVSAFVSEALIYELIRDVEGAYDIDTAVGNQLDIIGKYVGVSRTITGTTFTRDYFGLSSYGDTAPFDFNSYMLYGEIPPDIQYRSYEESSQSLFDLNDEEYRMIIKLKIVQNQSNFSIPEIDSFINNFFGEGVIFGDRFNMSIYYIFPKNLERLVTIAKSQNLIPKPLAVGASVAFTNDTSSIFSYSKYGGSAPTYAIGYIPYGSTESGGFLEYGTALQKVSESFCR